MNYYNLNAIVKIEVNDREPAPLFYRPTQYKKRFIFFGESVLKSPAGYIDNDIFRSYRVYSEKEIQDGAWHDIKLMTDGDKVYFKPNVTIRFVDDSFKNFVFETKVEAESFAIDILLYHRNKNNGYSFINDSKHYH